jgi:leader peptidase (prepilin peptidase)/N-methyltransferase
MSFSELLSSQPWLLVLSAALLGLCVGSFINVVVYRLPRMMERDWQHQSREMLGLEGEALAPFNLAVPPSHCPHCDAKVRARDNIPVLSFLLLRGHCRECQAPISARYPLIELSTVLLSVLVVLHFGPTWQSAFVLLFTWVLIAAAMIDVDTMLLPDSLTLPLLWLGLLVNTQDVFTPLSSAVIGAAVGYLTLWIVYWCFKLITGREGMGYGDFKLLAALGAWLGWQSIPLIVLLSSVVGAAVGIALIVGRGRDRAAAIPFGPYLAAAGFIAMLWRDTLGAYLFSGVY